MLLAFQAGLTGLSLCSLEVGGGHIDAVHHGHQASQIVIAQVTKSAMPQLRGCLGGLTREQGQGRVSSPAADSIDPVDPRSLGKELIPHVE
jgi:hypothetical protein